jgi:hypothetical protein
LSRAIRIFAPNAISRTNDIGWRGRADLRLLGRIVIVWRQA